MIVIRDRSKSRDLGIMKLLMPQPYICLTNSGLHIYTSRASSSIHLHFSLKLLQDDIMSCIDRSKS